MINLRLITFLATLAYTQSTLATINIIVPSNLNITNVSVSGPSCSTRNSSPPITMNEKSDTSTGSYTTVGFDAMGASAIPGKNEVSWTDCTMSVDFIYPQGFQMAGLTAVTHGFVAFEMGGMVQEISLDMWFPSLPFLVVSLLLTFSWHCAGKADYD
jgi:hypothetical protein